MSRSRKRPIIKDKTGHKGYNRIIKRAVRQVVNQIKYLKDKEDYTIPHLYEKVNQYDIFGNFIRSWDAISDIERSLGFATTNISKCCKGLIKTSNGYIFLYEGDSIQQRLIELKGRKHKGKIESKIYELQ